MKIDENKEYWSSICMQRTNNSSKINISFDIRDSWESSFNFIFVVYSKK